MELAEKKEMLRLLSSGPALGCTAGASCLALPVHYFRLCQEQVATAMQSFGNTL